MHTPCAACPCRFAEFALLEQPSSESLGHDSPPSQVQIVVQVSLPDNEFVLDFALSAI